MKRLAALLLALCLASPAHAVTQGEALQAISTLTNYVLGVPTPPVVVPPVVPPVTPPVTPPVPGSIEVPWGQGWSIRTIERGGFTCEAMLVFSITPPADAQPGSQAGQFSVSEYGGLPTFRQLVLSRSPGSFDLASAIAQSQGTTATINYYVGGRGLVPGQTAYINLRNWSTDLNATGCAPGSQTNIIAGNQPPRAAALRAKPKAKK